ncbi:phospholipid scramblase-related protein [Uliginosibacterium flavum]|uniref:Phospholipid scramblase-related protein n=1 Tax=Uliginosibacterium flavum TaxID=1396831 RepID=A0ABV2TP75_9RHOO
MHPILERNTFFVKEHVGMFKAANNFDIFDPDSNQTILLCREPNLGFFTKMLRFTDYKRYTPFHIEITDTSNQPVLHIKRGISIFRSTVEVLDAKGQKIGSFQQKLLSLGGKFEVLDASGNSLCWLKGSWSSWDFRFEKNDKQIAQVTKKWAGIGKELFTSADNYMLIIDPVVPSQDPVRQLILAAVMCIDMVLKE